MGEPVGALAADGGHDLPGVIRFSLIGDDPSGTAVLDEDILDHGIKFDPYPAA